MKSPSEKEGSFSNIFTIFEGISSEIPCGTIGKMINFCVVLSINMRGI